MPKIVVHDIEIMYEAYGKGETIVYLQTPFGGINPGAYYMAGRLSKTNRVIIWDSPNVGQSGIAIKDIQSEWHLVCEYLKGLLEQLGEKTTHLVGCSGGGELGLLFTHLYPEMVKSLAMYRPTDTTSDIEKEIIKARYFDIAEIADKHSMAEVIEYSENPSREKWGYLSGWIAQCARKNREKISEFDNKTFSRIMWQWGHWMESAAFYRANLSDAELAQIKIPVLIMPCADEYHPEEIAKDLHEKLPFSTYIPSKKFRNDNEIYDANYEEHPFGGFVDFIDEYQRFLLNV